MSNLLDSIFSAFLFFVFALASIIGLSVFLSINSTGLFGSYSAAFQNFYTSLNNVAVFIAIGISLAAVFAGLMIRTHPVFFVVAMVLVFVEFMVTPTFVTTYNSIAITMPANVQSGMALQIQILQMLPVLTALGTVLTVIVGIIRE